MTPSTPDVCAELGWLIRLAVTNMAVAPYFENSAHVSEQPVMRRIEMHVTCIKYSKFNIMSVETLKKSVLCCALCTNCAFEMCS